MSLCNSSVRNRDGEEENENEEKVKNMTNNNILPVNNLAMLKPQLTENNTTDTNERFKNRANSTKVVKFNLDRNKIFYQNDLGKEEAIFHFSEITEEIKNEQKEANSNLDTIKIKSNLKHNPKFGKKKDKKKHTKIQEIIDNKTQDIKNKDENNNIINKEIIEEKTNIKNDENTISNIEINKNEENNAKIEDLNKENIEEEIKD